MNHHYSRLTNVRAGWHLSTVSALTLLAALPAFAADDAEQTTAKKSDKDQVYLEEILVTSQRKSESLQDVPVAVTALDGAALEKHQIETASDLQFQTPNVTFSKSNFTDSNFQIRGIGNALVAASSDSGVGIHINDVPVNAPRLFEAEYFDIERIEILRGPQGTLFGRNSTGGTVNVITKKPTDELEGSGEFEYGNFNSVKAKGMINVPFGGEKGAFRLAGVYVNRDGYTENLAATSSNGLSSRIDGRNLYSVRGSIRLEPSDNTSVNLMASYFKEDDNRARSQKQLCHRDPTGVLGCLPDSLGYDTANANSTLVGVLTSSEFLNAIGFGIPVAPGVTLGDLLAAGSVAGPDANASNINPKNMRQVYTDFEPVYKTDETMATLHIEHEFDKGSLSLIGGYQKTNLISQEDYNMNTNPAQAVPIGLAYLNPTAYAQFYSGGTWPISSVAPGHVGVIGGNIFANVNSPAFSYDQSSMNAEQWSAEAHYTSHLDGKFNFLLGATYLDYSSTVDYYVIAAGLDYVSFILPGTDGAAMATPYYQSETNYYGLKSWALFGEVYYDVTDNFKLTGGLRYTNDEKSLKDRQPLYTAPVAIGTSDASSSLPAFRDDKITFKEFTGRLVAEWRPQDGRMFYASYSRGYKGGGFNPPSFSGAFAPTFEPEFINAFEVGTKNTFMDGRLTANLAGFYYDYKGLQVSKIVDRTSVNENIDAKIWGLESEFVAALSSEFVTNLSVSYLHTKIGDTSSADPRDPSGGVADSIIVKDLSNGSNCVVLLNGAPAPISTVDIPNVAAAGAFSFCDALAASLPAPYEVKAGGVDVSLKGNELRQAPKWQINLGGQYTHDFNNGMTFMARADYYWQSSMWGRIFNTPADKISSFDVLNLQAKLSGNDDRWYVKAFVRNLLNSDNVTGMYLTDPSSGLYTNLFTLEPRRFGVAVGFKF
ncbi:TonB-dependent receptor [Kordiimonas marina]|uniref:TonB-dependent receptor n=1 Tax=Kordiimonas marina TaxID=2872312 RepID=UPI001FF5D17A|nr:TonB-dependent receptor [Kordiimonas marina]MCJ9429336.1 TonB-dependent receptor [Kordiimonas marina]